MNSNLLQKNQNIPETERFLTQKNYVKTNFSLILELLTFVGEEYALVIELELHVNKLIKYKNFFLLKK